jgi:ribosome-associated protein
VEDIEIGEDGIRLGQLLKLASIADTGGSAKDLLASGLVRVNGDVETKRGRQLQPGDVVSCAGTEVRVTAAP